MLVLPSYLTVVTVTGTSVELDQGFSAWSVDGWVASVRPVRLMAPAMRAVADYDLRQNQISLVKSSITSRYLDSVPATMLLQKLRPELCGARFFHSRANRDAPPLRREANRRVQELGASPGTRATG
jgi:hypothetical protein